MEITPTEGGRIVFTCVKVNSVGENEEYKDIGLLHAGTERVKHTQIITTSTK